MGKHDNFRQWDDREFARKAVARAYASVYSGRAAGPRTPEPMPPCDPFCAEPALIEDWGPVDRAAWPDVRITWNDAMQGEAAWRFLTDARQALAAGDADSSALLWLAARRVEHARPDAWNPSGWARAVKWFLLAFQETFGEDVERVVQRVKKDSPYQ